MNPRSLSLFLPPVAAALGNATLTIYGLVEVRPDLEPLVRVASASDTPPIDNLLADQMSALPQAVPGNFDLALLKLRVTDDEYVPIDAVRASIPSINLEHPWSLGVWEQMLALEDSRNVMSLNICALGTSVKIGDNVAFPTLALGGRRVLAGTPFEFGVTNEWDILLSRRRELAQSA